MVNLKRSSAEHDDLPARTLLADVLPTFDLSEVHAIWIPARPEKVFAAAKAVTAGEVRMLAPLEMVRGLPSIVGGHRPFLPNREAPLIDRFAPGVIRLGERADAARACRHPRVARGPGDYESGPGFLTRGTRGRRSANRRIHRGSARRDFPLALRMRSRGPSAPPTLPAVGCV